MEENEIPEKLQQSLVKYIITAVILLLLYRSCSTFTDEYTLCPEVKNIVIDFDDPNIQGNYRYKWGHGTSSLSVGKNVALGCIDQMNDNLSDSCHSDYSGSQKKQQFSGKWRVSRTAYRTNPGVLLRGFNTSIMYITLEQAENKVAVAFFYIDNYLYELAKITSDSSKVEEDMLCLVGQKLSKTSLP